MTSPQHRTLLARIASIDLIPEDSSTYEEWLKASAHLTLLKQNANSDELIVCASSTHAFVYAVLVSRDALSDHKSQDLLDWTATPFRARSGYSWGGARDDVWIDETNGPWPTIPDEHTQQLLFARTFHGLTGDDTYSYEILQEYLHVSEIFWRPEKSAYCCLDEHGDFTEIISLTTRSSNGDMTLVTFQREKLEQYLAASNLVLVHLFDFTIIRRESFRGWANNRDEKLYESDNLVYRQHIEPDVASYTRGVQIVPPSRPNAEIFNSIRNGTIAVTETRGVEFIAIDWRNNRVTDISTHPTATTNYFEASSNSLPFDVSPAFFRPEVLLKYKADRDKYHLSEENRTIDCRGVWHLQTYDINDEGQVHTYICYLRTLPYDEQLYWRSFNENPKSGISKRALQTDFEGEWSEIITPLEKVLHIARRWSELRVEWWTLREESLVERVSTPRTSSRDEWARSFLDLAKLVIEGFQIKPIRARLGESGVAYARDERSLRLIERYLAAHHVVADDERLVNLRTVQYVRSGVDAHFGGSGARRFAADALENHGSYTAHFESVCEGLARELEMIEKALS